MPEVIQLTSSRARVPLPDSELGPWSTMLCGVRDGQKDRPFQTRGNVPVCRENGLGMAQKLAGGWLESNTCHHTVVLKAPRTSATMN